MEGSDWFSEAQVRAFCASVASVSNGGNRLAGIIPHQFGKFGGIGGDRCAIGENTLQIKLRADSATLPCQYGGGTNDHNGAQNARTTIFDGSIFVMASIVTPFSPAGI